MPRISHPSSLPSSAENLPGAPLRRVTRRQALRTLGALLTATSAAAMLQAWRPAARQRPRSPRTGQPRRPHRLHRPTRPSQPPPPRPSLRSKAPAAKAGLTEFIAAIENPPPTLDHQTEPSLWGFCGVEIVQDGIVGEDRDFKPVPALAESWENPNPTTWNFKLRSGVKFHNGKVRAPRMSSTP